MKQEEVTIIIPSFHPEHHSLTRKALGFTLDSLKTFKGEIRLALNGKGTKHPQGQCKATNRMAKEAKTDWLLVTNNDMVFEPNFFDKFLYEVENRSLLVASPNLVEPKKGAPPFIEKFCGGVGVEDSVPDFKLTCFLDFIKTQKPHMNVSALPTNEPVETGFNLPFIIRKDVWDTIGGYDEDYDPWGSNSDSDLQYRIMLAGITPMRIRSSLVYHFSNTSGTFHPDHQAAWAENQRRFTEKFGVERASSPDIWYKPDISQVTYKPDYLNKYAV